MQEPMDELSMPDWVKPGISFRFRKGLGRRKTPREIHVRAIVDGMAVLRELNELGDRWTYFVEDPGFFIDMAAFITHGKSD